MVQCCICRRLSICTECIVAKRYVLEQKLLLTAYRESYEKSIYTKMNDLDLCLEVVSRSRQPFRYIRRWISRKPLEIETWFVFQRTTNRKWHMGYQMVTWPTTSRDSQRCCEAVKSAILATAWLLFIFCCFWGAIMTLSGVINYVFAFIHVLAVLSPVSVIIIIS